MIRIGLAALFFLAGCGNGGDKFSVSNAHFSIEAQRAGSPVHREKAEAAVSAAVSVIEKHQ